MPAAAAIELAREAGALVSVDLASIGPLLADGRRAARALIAEVAPDLLFATASEAAALLGGRPVDGLLEFAPTAVVKRGPKGATVLARVGDASTRVRGRHRARRRGRHDRRRRRLRRRVPGRLVRGPFRRPIAAGVAPACGRGRPSGGGTPAVDPAGGVAARLTAATLSVRCSPTDSRSTPRSRPRWPRAGRSSRSNPR